MARAELLSTSWPLFELGNPDITKTTSGGTPTRSEKKYYGGGIKWVKSGELKENLILDSEEKITKEGLDNSSAKLFPKNTVLVAMYGANVGRLGILGVEAATNQAICGIVVNEKKLNYKYLFYFLMSQKETLIKKSFGGAQPNISQEVIRKIMIPLPALKVQGEIVKMLEKFFEDLSMIKQGNENQINKNSAFFEAALNKLCFSQKWKLRKIDEIVENPKQDIVGGPFGSNLKTDDYTPSGVRIIRLQNIKRGLFDDKNPIFTSKEKAKELERHSAKGGDLILAKLGAIGDTCILPDEISEAILVADCIRIRINKKKVNIQYLLWMLNSNFCRGQLFKKVKGTTRPRVNLSDIRELQIPLPEKSTQDKIAANVSELFEIKNAIMAEQKFIQESIKMLPKSVMMNAFSGELIK